MSHSDSPHLEQAVYVDSNGCEHLTFPDNQFTLWPLHVQDRGELLQLARVQTVK